MIGDMASKESKTYTYYTTKEGDDPFKIFDAFFRDKNKTNKKKSLIQIIQNFGKNHFVILFSVSLLVVAFIIFYIMSVSSWNDGKCLLLVPYFSHSTNESCAGLDGALTNAIYLFITFMIIVIVSSFLRRKK